MGQEGKMGERGGGEGRERRVLKVTPSKNPRSTTAMFEALCEHPENFSKNIYFRTLESLE